MRLRTWVVALVVVAVVATILVAMLGTAGEDDDRLSYRAAIDLTGECRTPPIVAGARTWATTEAVPAAHTGVVDGTLWISGTEGIFVGSNGDLSLRYQLVDDVTSLSTACATR
jgi:hypothetical protein